MQSQLAKHFRQARLGKSLTTGQLARLVGYRNISKGANRIKTFEDSGNVRAELLFKLADALGIDQQTTHRLVDEDRRRFFEEWNAWANEPIRPYVVVEIIAAIYCHHELPEKIQSVEDAKDYTAALCRKQRHRACLVLSRRLSVWFDRDGTILDVTEAVPGGEPNQPVAWIGKKPWTRVGVREYHPDGETPP